MVQSQDQSVETSILGYRLMAIRAIQVAMFTGTFVCFLLFIAKGLLIPLVAAGSCCVSAASFVLTYKGRLTLAASILAVQFLALPMTLGLSFMGIYDPIVLLFPAGMVSLSILLAPWRTAVYVVFNVAGAVILAVATYLEANGVPLRPGQQQLIREDSSTLLVTVLFVGCLAVFISYLLTSLLEKLAAHQHELEGKVEQRTAELSGANEDLGEALLSLEMAQDELLRGEKLASLGRMVAGVAHELNTPIGNAAVTASSLRDYAQDMSTKMHKGPLKKSDLTQFVATFLEGTDLLLRATERARDLVSSFKEVAVDQTSDRRRAFDLAQVASDVVRSMKPGLKGEPWQIQLAVESGISCDGYPGAITQIITNLLENALRHAFSGREIGTIEIGAILLGRGRFEMTVSDDGNGIAPEALGMIFDPFFTTRLGQGGSGLGLTIVHNLTTSVLGGGIKVESALGSGTRFVLNLPQTAPKPLAQAKG